MGLGGAGFGSGRVGETPVVGLGARFGALDLRSEVSAAGLVGMPGRLLPTFPVWFVTSCVSSLPVSVTPPLEGLGGRLGVVCPAVVLFSWTGAPRLALGATGGLGGGLVCWSEGVSLGGGGLGAGMGVAV